jgi:deazaflavin-dependent oxidoreductase (nitroreductase family)
VPIPRAVARFNKRVLNRVMTPLARRTPGFAVVTHVGRTSGSTYRSPVNLFRVGDAYAFVLTYGPDSDWVQNVQAAGECDIETRRRRIHLVEPNLIQDPDRRRVPRPVRPILRLLNVDHFLVMHAE